MRGDAIEQDGEPFGQPPQVDLAARQDAQDRAPGRICCILGDFELALRGLLGEAAPLSASSILRLKADWQAQYDAWRARDLADLPLVYLWADGLYVKAGLEDTKAALLVASG